MELNLKFYKGKDEYSDGIIEDKILDLIKKYPNNYEEAFKEDSSWPVFYHLSDIRKNVIRWYPFKKDASILEVGGGMGAITEELCQKCKFVTSIELSKRRATAILERNKNANNLEIIVGNFKDIVLEKKYDYILLNGVLEYSSLYIDSENPYEDFINKLKLNLKENGKILIAIENRFGLKYWCGSNEDHTGIPFNGINGYSQNKNIRTFSKNELEALAKKCNLNTNFYYIFPDYKFPKIIYTDVSLNQNLFTEYTPYYYTKMNLVVNEIKLFKDIYDNNKIPFFANSYFIELAVNKEKNIIEFAKFNNEYRASKYNFCTYLKENKFYKLSLNKIANEKIEDIKKIDELLNSKKIKTAKVIDIENGYYSELIEGQNLKNILINHYNNNNFEEINSIYDMLYKMIKQSAGKEIGYTQENIFNKYHVKVAKKELEKMHFYEHGIIDMIPNNIIISNNEYVLIDQEWYEENTPLEYILYRAISYLFICIGKKDGLIDDLYKKYNINPKIFEKLEESFLNNIRSESFKYFLEYAKNNSLIENLNELVNTNKSLINERENLINQVNNIISEKNSLLNIKTNLENEKNDLLNIKTNLENEKNNLINKNNALENETKILNYEIQNILNSKRYKFVSFFADLKKRFKFKRK